MKKKASNGSLRGRLLLVVLLLLSSMVISLGGYSATIINNLTVRMLDESQNTIEQYMADFQHETRTAEEYLSYMAINNSHFRMLTDAPDAQTMYLDAHELQSDLDTLVGISGGRSLVMLYHTGLDYALSVRHGASANDEMRLMIQRGQRIALADVLRAGDYCTDSWFCLSIEGEALYTRVVQYEQICCCFAYPLSALAEGYATTDGSSVLLYQGQHILGEPLSISLPEQGAALVGFSPRYLVTQASLGDVTLVNLRPDVSGLTGALPTVLLVLTVVVLLVFAGCILYLWMGFYRPVAHLAEAMHHLDNGHLNPQQLDRVYSGAEFRQMNTALKNLLSQITVLRFEAYEKELERKDAQLQYLRAQIRPHFYLNCLKNLYAMALVSTQEKMQETILYLSKYMRYIFSDQGNLTTLEEELASCTNYVDLFSSMNMTYGVRYETEVPPELLKQDIPPVSVLTLVENCIKHSFREGQPLEILIRAALLTPEEGVPLLSISVRDNGPGFGKEWLQQFNTLENDPDGSQHVGMANVVRRFRELYGENFHIVFYNGVPQDRYCGACIDLFYAPKGGLPDETVDRG